MRKVVIIPAKKNSVRFPNKNRILFDLCSETITTLASLYEVVIVTDDLEITTSASQLGITVIDRPKWTTWVGVDSNAPVCHAIEVLGLEDEDIVCFYELTHIESKVCDVTRAFDLKSCFCLTETRYPMRKLLNITKDGEVVMWNGEQVHNYYMTSQNIEKSYIPTGVITNTAQNIKQFGCMYTPYMNHIIIDNDNDIDNKIDLNII